MPQVFEQSLFLLEKELAAVDTLSDKKSACVCVYKRAPPNCEYTKAGDNARRK